MAPPQSLLKELRDLKNTEGFDEAEEKRRRKAEEHAKPKAKLQKGAAKIDHDTPKRKATGEERQYWNNILAQGKMIDKLMVGRLHHNSHAYT
jgi:hypothetical protein